MTPQCHYKRACTEKKAKQNQSDNKLAAAVISKLEAGNFREAIRIICSDDKPAVDNAVTYAAWQDTHPAPPDNHRPFCNSPGNTRFQPLQISPYDMERSYDHSPDPLADRMAHHLSIFANYYLAQLMINYARPSQIWSIFC